MSYQHGVDKSIIPTVNILGVNVAAINIDWLLPFTVDHIREMSGDYMCFTNVHTTVMASEDAEYLAVQNGGVLASPDGGPLASVGRKRGAKDMMRTTGPNYMGAVFKISAEKGYRHFFFGSTDDTLKLLRESLNRDYPGIQIVGMYSPPFRPMTEEEDQEIVNQINAAHADFVWIGLGAPKQEKWMAAHQGKIHGLMVGVGAGFNFHAGNLKRAPEWMQKTNLEWLFRLIMEPRRLFKRYFITNSKFIWRVMLRGK